MYIFNDFLICTNFSTTIKFFFESMEMQNQKYCYIGNHAVSIVCFMLLLGWRSATPVNIWSFILIAVKAVMYLYVRPCSANISSQHSIFKARIRVYRSCSQPIIVMRSVRPICVVTKSVAQHSEPPHSCPGRKCAIWPSPPR